MAPPSARFSSAALLLGALLFACLAECQGEGDILTFVKRTVDENPIVIFSKSYCGYCRRAKQAFASLSVSPHVIELDQREDGDLIQDALQEYVGRRTVPQVFIAGKHIGGSDDTVEAHESGRLKELVDAALGAKEL